MLEMISSHLFFDFVSHFIKTIYLGNCVMECCKKHGLPIKCLEQKLEANTEAEHNNTHMVITTIISKECHDYKSVLQECKKECMNVPQAEITPNAQQEELEGKPNTQGEQLNDH